MERIGIDALH